MRSLEEDPSARELDDVALPSARSGGSEDALASSRDGCLPTGRGAVATVLGILLFPPLPFLFGRLAFSGLPDGAALRAGAFSATAVRGFVTPASTSTPGGFASAAPAEGSQSRPGGDKRSISGQLGSFRPVDASTIGLEILQASMNGVAGQSFAGVAHSKPGGEANAASTSPHLGMTAGGTSGVITIEEVLVQLGLGVILCGEGRTRTHLWLFCECRLFLTPQLA